MRPNRSRLMKDAHKWFKDSKRIGLGMTWAQCLKHAWSAEKIRCTECYQRTYARAA